MHWFLHYTYFLICVNCPSPGNNNFSLSELSAVTAKLNVCIALTRKRVKVKVQVFFFPRSKISSKSRFDWKVYLITYLTLFPERFYQWIKSKTILYFEILISKWPKVFKEIAHGCFRVFSPYFMGKSPCTTCWFTFKFWSILVRP